MSLKPPIISARILAHSIGPCDEEIMSYVLTLPRYLLAELNKHGATAQGAASSRAIKTRRLIDAVIEHPASFVEWGADKPGMQAGALLTGRELDVAQRHWEYGAIGATNTAEMLLQCGVHKSIVNRALEPFAHSSVILTGTYLDGIWMQRVHPAAQPEFQELAGLMLAAYLDSTPKRLKAGEWHMPFREYVPAGADEETALKIVTARCARVSYVTFDKEFTPEEDIALHDRLKSERPKHLVPFEHSARAMGPTPAETETDVRAMFDPFTAEQILDALRRSGRFKGWTQYRKLVEPTMPKLSRDELVDLLAEHRKRRKARARA